MLSLLKQPVDKMLIWMKWTVGEMQVGEMQVSEMQVDEIEIWWNGKLMRWQVDEVLVQFCKLDLSSIYHLINLTNWHNYMMKMQ